MNRTASFRRSLTTSLAKAAVLIAAILAFVIPMAIGGAFDADPMATEEQVRAIRPPLPNSPIGLSQRHGCWNGVAPADVDYPRHVVVTDRDGDVRYAGQHMVDLAFEQLLGAVRDGRIVYVDHGIRVHAFCR